MKGFRDFVMRGNLVELAVAFIMGAAFATVVTALFPITYQNEYALWLPKERLP